MDFQGKKAVVGAKGVEAVDLTPEEITQQQVDAQTDIDEKAVKDAEETRLDLMRIDPDVQAAIDLIKTKTNAQIDAFYENATTAQLRKALAAITKIIALKVR